MTVNDCFKHFTFDILIELKGEKPWFFNQHKRDYAANPEPFCNYKKMGN